MSRNLSQGCTGADVRNLQILLNLQRGPHDQRISEDGMFGPETRARVKAFQTFCKLTPDGVVGPLTFAALAPERSHSTEAVVIPGGGVKVGAPATGAPGVGDPPPPPPPAPKPTPASPTGLKTFNQFQLLAGSQKSFGPSVFSPLVVTAQYNLIVRNPGFPDITGGVAGQFSLNDGGRKGPSGSWTGQGSGQVGLALNKKLFGVDLLNPSLVFMLSRNQGQSASWGFGVADQMNYALDKDGRMNLFLNGQLVWGIDFAKGDVTGPGLQILGGISFTLGQMPPDPSP